MNKIIVMGRLTKDPETVATQSGTILARYTVAVDRKYKKEGSQSTDFFNCTSFGKQADFVWHPMSAVFPMTAAVSRVTI